MMRSVNVVCVVAVLLMASVDGAATIRYKGSGSWDDIDPSDGAGWEGGVMPGSGDTVRFNWGDNTVTLDYAGRLLIGFKWVLMSPVDWSLIAAESLRR